jgi:hypothetical protein
LSNSAKICYVSAKLDTNESGLELQLDQKQSRKLAISLTITKSNFITANTSTSASTATFPEETAASSDKFSTIKPSRVTIHETFPTGEANKTT